MKISEMSPEDAGASLYKKVIWTRTTPAYPRILQRT